MNETLKELSAVFQIVSSIPVTGDSIDTMAVVRSKLRKIYADIEKASLNVEAEPETPQE